MVRYVAVVTTPAGTFDVESCVTREYAERVAFYTGVSTGLPTDVEERVI